MLSYTAHYFTLYMYSFWAIAWNLQSHSCIFLTDVLLSCTVILNFGHSKTKPPPLYILSAVGMFFVCCHKKKNRYLHLPEMTSYILSFLSINSCIVWTHLCITTKQLPSSQLIQISSTSSAHSTRDAIQRLLGYVFLQCKGRFDLKG